MKQPPLPSNSHPFHVKTSSAKHGLTLADYARRMALIFLLASGMFLIIFIGLLGFPLPLLAAGFHYVAPTGVDSLNCSISTPCRTIQQAVDNAVSGDEIRVAAGVYTTTSGVQVVNLNKSLTLQGGFTSSNWITPNPALNATIIDAEGVAGRRVIYLPNVVVATISGFQIRGGRVIEGRGAGVYNERGTLTLINSQIYDNQTTGTLSEGGGVASGISGNPATLTLRGNLIYSNTANIGGGVEIVLGQATLEANKIFDNVGTAGAGGILATNGTVRLKSNFIYNNTTSSSGGGLAVSLATVFLENNTVYGNSATSNGGGLFTLGGTVFITNTLIVSNTAVVTAGGIYNPGATLSVAFTDFFGNSPNDGPTAGTGNNTNTNPQFVNPATFNLHLPASGSPALNSGTNTSATIDIDGEARPFGITDRGADEYLDLSGGCFARVQNGPVFTTVQAAIGAASAGGTVQVAGRCQGTQSISGLQQTTYISKNLTIHGGYTVTDWLNASYGPTILDANLGGRVVYVTGTAAITLDSLHLTGGSTAGNGAGVYLGGSGSALLQNDVIYSNSASGDGGSVYQAGGPALLQHNTLHGNTAARGGGVFAASGTVTLRNSIVTNNNAGGGNGGGVHAGSGSFVLSYNDLNGNSAPQYGNVTPSTTDLAVAPNFVNPAGPDFHLQYTSQLINAADPASTLTSDYENNLRPQGPRADIGADESSTYPGVAISDGPGRVFTDVTQIQGQVITFNHTITNTGLNPSLSDTFNLSISNSLGWPASLVGIASPVSLASGASQSFQVVVTVPVTITGSIYDQTVVTATSQANASTFDTSIDLIANPGVIIAPSYTQNADPGTVVTYTHTLTNTGPVSDTFVVSAVSDQVPPWGSVAVPTTTVIIQPNTSIQVTVVVSVPLSSEAGLTERLRLTASSTQFPGVSSTVTDTTTANAIFGDRYVATSGTDTINNCHDKNKPCRTVKRALEQVVGVGSTVRVAQGTYNEAGLLILKTITLQGGWDDVFVNRSLDPTITIIDGGGQDRVLQISNNSPSIVEYFTIRGGRRIGGGGGIYIEGTTSPTLRFLIINNNQATDGGGIYNTAGTLTLQNSQVFGNQASASGGGIYNGSGTLRVQDNEIYSNQAATLGGGGYNLNGTLVVTNSSIYSNTATQNGGGLLNGGGTFLVQNNFVYSNTAVNGGGIAVTGGTATIEFDSLYANRASSGTGAGIWLNGGTSSIRNTVVFNQTGSGINRTSGTVSHNYNDVFQNSGGDYIGLTAGPNSLAVDPRFENVGSGNLHLLPDSPVLDQADPASTVTTDIDDDARPSDQGPDMGADELTGCRANLNGTIYLILQDAVDDSLPGQTILVSGTCRGVHRLDIGGGQTLSQTVHITKNITIQGGWNFGFNQHDPILYPTTLDARGLGRTTFITGTATTLKDMNFIHGNAAVAGGPNGGGGMYLVNATPTLSNTLISDNTAAQGAGVFGSNSNFVLEGGQIFSNTATSQGGGLYNSGGASLVQRSRIYNNQAAAGGGLYNNIGVLIVRNNFIYGNTVSGNGGGFYNAAISSTVLHNTFYANQAAAGGGLFNAGSSSALDVRSNIFAFNIAGSGGALNNAGTTTFAYNDVANNSVPEVVGASGVNNITNLPLFVDVTIANFHLVAGSPGIDVGDPSVTLADDIDLDPRPNNQGFDIGADEQAGCYASLASAPAIIYASVQLAVWNASNVTPDVVQVAGICQGVQSLALGGGSNFTQTVAVTKNVTLQGGWTWDPNQRRLINYNPAARATLDAVNLGRVLLITNSAVVTVETFSISSGNAAPGGGGIVGGGIYNVNGTLTVRGSDLFSNTATGGNGGALYNAAGSLTLQATNVFSNQATNGAAVYLNGGTQLLIKSLIYSNTATNGGAVYLNGGTASLQTNTIRGNQAALGAAIYHASAGTSTLQNNLLYRNQASNRGGGFYNAGGNPLVQFNTFYNNSANTSGGGGIYSAAGNPNINSNLVVTNTNVGLFVAGGSPTVRYNDFFGNSGGNVIGTGLDATNLSADPLFTNAAGDDFHLFNTTSPAWDKGDPASTLPLDFEDQLRPSDQAPDIGADEINNCFARLNGGTPVGNPQLVVNAATSSSDVIDIAGTCTGIQVTGGLSQTLYISKTLTIQGGWSTSPPFGAFNPSLYPTILDALGRGRVLYITGGGGIKPKIQDLNLGNGNATASGLNGFGGGIFNNSDAILTRLNVFSSTATSGGGFYSAAGLPDLTVSRIFNNSATNGAGIYVATGTPRIWNNLVWHNTATTGGGFYLTGAGISFILNNTVYSNTASGQGGGIYIAGSPDVRNMIVDSNRAGSGGGIFVASGSPTLKYNDVSRTVAGGNYNIADPTGTNGNISSNPLFAAESIFDFRQNFPIAPVVDAGDPATPALVDKDFVGVIRPTHQYVDMGAYELGGCLARLISNPGTVYGSPQLAINLASDGDTVQIAGTCYGVHKITVGSTISQTVHLTRSVNLEGGYNLAWENTLPEEPTVLDALGRGRALYIGGGSSQITGLLMGDGNAAGLGGGTGGLDAGGCVYIAGGTPAFQGADHISDCVAQLGGGLYNVNSDFLMYNTGIYFSEASQNGGGFYNAGGSPRLQNMLVLENLATTNGGGVYVAGGSPQFWHLNLVGNQADTTLGGLGGGLYNAASGTIIYSTIFQDNRAAQGGGLYNAGSTTVDYSNWWLNTATDVPATADSNIFTGTNSLQKDPIYLADGYHLSESSPLIDAGAPITPPVGIDIDIDPRRQLNGYDIGLDEVPERVSFTFTPDPPADTHIAAPCDVFVTTHVLRNTGNKTDTYTVTLQSDTPDWGNQLGGDPIVVTLAGGQSVNVFLQIFVPCDAVGNTVNTTVLVATSASSGLSDPSTAVTTVTPAYGVEINPVNFGAAVAGQTITYTHLVTNLGNTTDTFGLSLSPDYSNPIVTPTQITLGPKVSSTITVTVTIANWAAVGLTDIVDVVAYKLDNQNVQDATADYTTILRRTGVRYVAVNGKDVDPETGIIINNCTNLTQGACGTIQNAINQASPGDEIWISAGVYTDIFTATVGSDTLAQAVYLDKSVTLRGGYNASHWEEPPNPISYTVVINPANQGRAVYVSQAISPTAPITLQWLSLVNGNPTGAGGGPGGVNAGGNLYNEGADLTLNANRIYGNNVSTSVGGGLYSGGGNLKLYNNLLHNSQAITGGAVYIAGGSATLLNNTFYNNTATSQGAAVYAAGTALAITNTIFANNNSGSGAAVFAASGTAALKYNLYNGNTASDVGGIAVIGSPNVLGDPLFVAPGAVPPNLRLLLGSPAIDQGDPTTNLTVDFDNDARPLGLGFDIGADERVPSQGLLFYPDTFTTTLAGATIVQTHILQNQGDLTDTFTISATTLQPSWVITFDQSIPYLITLGPAGISQTVVVTYQVPISASGQTNVTILTATSSLTTIFASLTDTIRVSSPLWQISKTVTPTPTVRAGDHLTYTLAITNVGDLDTVGVYTITDPLPANTSFVSASPPGIFDGVNVVWVLSTPVLSNSGGTGLSYVVAVTQPLTTGTTIVNQNYTIAGGGAPTPALGVPVTVTVDAPASLSIAKTANPSPVQPSDYLTYTITISNAATAFGPAVGVVVSDTLPVGVAYQSMGFVAPATGIITDTASPTLLWQLTNPIPAGGSAQVTVTVRLTSPLAAGTLLTNTFGATASNIATVLSGTLVTPVVPTNIITLAKTVAPTRTVPGGVVAYTLTLSNTGNGLANVTLTDTLATGFNPPSYSTSVVVPGRTWNTTAGVVTLSFTATAPITQGVYSNTLVTATYDLTQTTLSNTAPVTVEVPTVDFNSATYSVNEGSGLATITVTLSAASALTATVNYASSNGTATAGSDYTAVTGLLTFPPGVITQTFTVPITNDAVFEGNETLTLTLSTPGGAALTNVNNPATLTIIENDTAPTVTFSSAVYSVNEGSGPAVITVTLSNASIVTATVNYASSNGTATAGSDYTAATGLLTFSPGITLQTFTVPITDDALFEANETITLTLSGAVNANTTNTPATLTIVDNDNAAQPLVSFSSAAYSVPENTLTPAAAVITVTLSTASGVTTTVNYASSNGTATAGSDYTAASGTLTFAPGITSQTFLVPINDDFVYEGDETVTLTLTLPVSATLVSPSVAILTIVEDETAPTFNFSSATYNYGEANGPATITVTLSSPSVVTATVNYSTSNGTATAGSDYTAVSGLLTFPPGITSRTFTVPITNDTVFELDETVDLHLSGAVNAGLGLNSATLTILNDDSTPQVDFSSASYSVNEGTGSATITVTLSAPFLLTATVNYAITAGSATAGSDYANVNGTLTFAPGLTSLTFNVPITDDLLYESNETITLTLSNPVSTTIGTNPAILTIVDNDTPIADFSSATYSVNENAGTATITVTLSTIPTVAGSVAYASSNNTATASSDYTAVSNTLTLIPGQTVYTFTVPIINDLSFEGNETLTLTLSNPVSATVGVANNPARLTIVDDDPLPTVDFTSATYSVNEASGPAIITVTLSAASSVTATVNYATSNNTATAGSDYAARSGTLTFSPGITNLTFSVPITNDTIFEGNETVTLTLSSPVSATLNGNNPARLTIVDDEVAPIVGFSSPAYSVSEAGISATITITLSTASSITATVNYATSDNTATAGSDYTARSGTLTFSPGTISLTFTVPITNDVIQENNEIINLTLSSAVSATLSLTNPVPLTIVDDDDPIINFSSATYSVNEGNSPAIITVTLSTPPDLAVTVNYAASNGTALAGSDYLTSSGSLTFTPGITLQTFTIPITDDALFENNETVRLTLSVPTHALPGATMTATLTIIDNDTAPKVDFSSPAYSVNEAAITATVIVTLSQPSGLTATVNYATTPNTASAGLDYLNASGTLTFAPGVITRTFGVTILNDTLLENNETLTLTLSTPVSATLGSPGNNPATLTIVDNDPPPTATFSVPSYSVSEAGGAATITVTLSTASGITATVNYASSNNTATAGSDYIAVSGILTFTPGVTRLTFSVPITDDALLESNETLTLTLSSPVSATLSTNPSATLTIVDNDTPTVDFSSPTYSISEDAGIVSITATLSFASNLTTTVNYSTSNNTATAGSDYVAQSGTLTFSPGITRQTFIVPISDDTFYEGNETVRLALSGATNAFLGSVNNPATLTIVENDQAKLYMPFVFKDFSVVPVNGPDLVITNIVLTPLGGNNYKVQVTARNQGNQPVTFGNNFHVNLYLDGNLSAPIIIWGVQASWFGVGQSRVSEANYTFSSGSHTLQAWADAYNVVVESNEANNTFTLSGVVIAGTSDNNEIDPSTLPAGPQPTPTIVP